MASTSTNHEDLVEEREELMVFPSENHIIKKPRFLKPHVTTTIDGSEAILRPAPSPSLKASSLCVSFCGWRLPNKRFKYWARKMAALHKPTWIKAGIFEAIAASTYKIHKDPSLILSLAQKWCPETKSFFFPWGEATITLEDVTVLLGFSVLGSSVFAPLQSSEMEEAVEKLEKQRRESITQVSWISSFVDDPLEHEAFLVLWLSNFVFPDEHRRSISKDVFPIAVRLARGEKIALAPAALACLYRDLGKIHALASTENVKLSSLFKLVQVWIWERFKSVRPEPKAIPKGSKPRIAQWSGVKQRFDNVGLFLVDDFDWRPYTKPLENWKPPLFYIEEAKCVRIDDDDDEDDEFVSFARCVRVSQLVGIGCMENYYPNRVAMQFGLTQDLPGLATNRSRGASFTEKEAWEDYNRSVDGSTLYIPSRFDTGSVTDRYRGWWMRSVSEMEKEATETFNASNTVDHYDDDDDVSLKVLPLSQVLAKLGAGTKKAEKLTNKRRERAREDDNESAMDCCQTQCEEEEEEDDSITIAHIIKSRKKSGDVEDTGGGDAYGGLEADYNVARFLQKLASGDETVAIQETEARSEENDENNSSDPSNGVAEKEEDDSITIAHVIKSTKQSDGVVEDTEGGDAHEALEERSRLEVLSNNVSELPQNLAYGAETVAATPEIEQRSEENDENNSSNPPVASSGVAEKEEEEDVTDDESLKQRKHAIEKLALKLEARILQVEKTLAMIKQRKMTRNHTKTPVST